MPGPKGEPGRDGIEGMDGITGPPGNVLIIPTNTNSKGPDTTLQVNRCLCPIIPENKCNNPKIISPFT